jgi:lysophospholipase L1-like esterase
VGQGGEALVLPLDHGHLNATGNRLVGDAAAPEILKLLPP